MKLQSLVKQSALYTVGNIANRLAGFLLIPLYTSFLSPSEFGILALIDLFLSLAVITLGVQSIGGAMIRIFHDFDDPRAQDRVVSTSILAMSGLNLAITAAALALAPEISDLIFASREHADLIRLSFVAMFSSNLVELLLVHERIRQRALFFVGFSLIQLCFTLGLNVWFIAFEEMGVWGFVWSKLIATSLGGLFLLVRAVLSVGLRFDHDAAKRILSFGSPLIIAGVSFFLIHFSDYFFLNRLRSTHEVGLYEFAYRFPFLLSFLVGEPFGRVWSVSVYDLAKDDGWKERFARVLAWLAFSLVLCGLGIAVFSDEVIELMARNESFWSAAAVVPVLVLAYALREAADFFRNVLYLNKRSGLIGRLALGCATINIALNLLVIPAWGYQGAALCTVLTWALYFAVCLVAQRQEYDIRLPWLGITSCAVFAVLCWSGTTFVPDETWWLRYLGNSVFILIFVVGMVLSPYFSSDEKASARAWIADSRAKLSGRRATE